MAEMQEEPVTTSDAPADLPPNDVIDPVEQAEPAAPRPAPDRAQIKCILEGALLASGETLGISRLAELFEEHERPTPEALRELLDEITADYAGRGIELREVASGFRIQVRKEYGPWVSRLWTEKPPRYSRALLETLALIAYRQPITRGEIEEIRGVAVSTEMIKSLMERDWIREVGRRDVPGRPVLYATTHDFLDYFNLKTLDEMPTLSEIRDLDKVNQELQLETPAVAPAAATDPATDPLIVLVEAGEGVAVGAVVEDTNDDAEFAEELQEVDAVLRRFEDGFRRRDDLLAEDKAVDAVAAAPNDSKPAGDDGTPPA